MHHVLPSQCHSLDTSKVLPKSIFNCSSSVRDEDFNVSDIEEGTAQKVEGAFKFKTMTE